MIYTSINIAVVVSTMPTNTGVIFNISIFELVISSYKRYKSRAEKASKAVAKRRATVNLGYQIVSSF
jgi:hypothetical protein